MCVRACVCVAPLRQVVDELLAHDSYDFREYFEEIDATLKWLKNPGSLPDDGVLTHGGCGKAYENIVMYSHSTGALVAALCESLC